MVKCKDCKFWGRTWTDGHGQEQRAYADSERIMTHRVCERIVFFDEYEKTPPPATDAFVIDGDQYQAKLFTPETFGCVLGEAK
jgi:hypothetical protein